MRRKGKCLQTSCSLKKAVMKSKKTSVLVFESIVESLVTDLRTIPVMKKRLSEIKGDCPSCDEIKRSYLVKVISNAEARISRADSRSVRVANRRLAVLLEQEIKNNH